MHSFRFAHFYRTLPGGILFFHIRRRYIHYIPFKWCFAIVKLVSQHNVSNILDQRLMSYYVFCCLQTLNKAAAYSYNAITITIAITKPHGTLNIIVKFIQQNAVTRNNFKIA